ncbi:MAG: hypothetical protein ACYCSX_01685 [Acidimicrobiales bacterium]
MQIAERIASIRVVAMAGSTRAISPETYFVAQDRHSAVVASRATRWLCAPQALQHPTPLRSRRSVASQEWQSTRPSTRRGAAVTPQLVQQTLRCSVTNRV